MPVTYPPAFDQRVIAGEVPGGQPMRASVVAPTIVTAARPFTLKVAVADDEGYPLPLTNATVTVRAAFAEPAAIEVAFPSDGPSVAMVTGVTIAQPGLYRFEVELNGKTFHSNPVCCGQTDRPGIYWGDPHVHTTLSDCHAIRCRSLNFCFSSGRYFAGLDWVSAADHVSNGRCELARWKDQVATSNAYNDAPDFVTLPAYEASFKGGSGGDNNYYMLRFPDMFVDGYDEGSVKTVCTELAEKLEPGEFFVVPHHTSRPGKHGEIGDDIYPGHELMPVVEIYSKWGASEYRGNPVPLKKIHPGPSYVVDLLARGLKLGFVGGTDTHSTMPAGYGDDHLDRLPGMTAVTADSLSRENVFRAIQNRNCYAASGERIYLDATVCGAAGGRTLSAGEAGDMRQIAVTVAARSDIQTIDVVRNGETIHTQTVDDWRGELTFTDTVDLSGVALESPHLGRFAYYYVRVTCVSGARAWSSPVWVILP